MGYLWALWASRGHGLSVKGHMWAFDTFLVAKSFHVGPTVKGHRGQFFMGPTSTSSSHLMPTIALSETYMFAHMGPMLTCCAVKIVVDTNNSDEGPELTQCRDPSLR